MASKVLAVEPPGVLEQKTGREWVGAEVHIPTAASVVAFSRFLFPLCLMSIYNKRYPQRPCLQGITGLCLGRLPSRLSTQQPPLLAMPLTLRALSPCLGFTKKTTARLAKCFEGRTTEKHYLALVHGWPEKGKVCRVAQ